MPKIKVQYYMLPWYLGESGGQMGSLNILTTSFPPTLLQVRSPSQTTLLIIKWTRYSSHISLIAGFSSLPTHRVIQTSRSHPPVGNRGCLTFLILQSLSPIALVVHSVPEHNPYVAHEVCAILPASGLWIYATDKLLLSHLPRVGCCVLGIPLALGQESLFYPQGE